MLQCIILIFFNSHRITSHLIIFLITSTISSTSIIVTNNTYFHFTMQGKYDSRDISMSLYGIKEFSSSDAVTLSIISKLSPFIREFEGSFNVQVRLSQFSLFRMKFIFIISALSSSLHPSFLPSPVPLHYFTLHSFPPSFVPSFLPPFQTISNFIIPSFQTF